MARDILHETSLLELRVRQEYPVCMVSYSDTRVLDVRFSILFVRSESCKQRPGVILMRVMGRLFSTALELARELDRSAARITAGTLTLQNLGASDQLFSNP